VIATLGGDELVFGDDDEIPFLFRTVIAGQLQRCPGFHIKLFQARITEDISNQNFHSAHLRYLLNVIDANGHSTAYQYDNVNNLLTVTDAAGKITSYGYDGSNNRVSFTNANGNTTTYDYDSLNRRTKVTDLCVDNTPSDCEINGLTRPRCWAD
jgi:YD repeat-containing protein